MPRRKKSKIDTILDTENSEGVVEKVKEIIEDKKETPISTLEKSTFEKNRKMRPTEWAREEGLDPHLFIHWESELLTRDEYILLKDKAL